MSNCNMQLGAVKAKEIDGELYISCWAFSKALSEKEREISELCKKNDELQKQISELESELAVKEEPLPFSCDECEGKIAKINLNDNVKVKLTPYGAEIYYHQFDETNKQARRTVIEPYMPEIDKDGYTQFQLHHFVNLYGEHIRMGNKNVIEPLDIILCD